MSKIRRVLRCYNCGEILQTKNPSVPGYIPEKLFNEPKIDDRVIYCERCFEKLKSINSGNLEQHVDLETAKILNDAKATDAMILWVIDLFTFNGTFAPEIVEKVKKLDIVVIATKRDLFSSSIKDETFKTFIEERFKEAGLKLKNVLIFGNNDAVDLNELITYGKANKKGHDIYMIGNLASGKTTIIHKLLKNYKNNTKWTIKTETYKGTNVKVLSIPLTNSSFLYELPGLSLTTSVLGKVEKEVLKSIVPVKKIKTITYPLTAGDSIVLGSLAHFTLVEGKPTSAKLYTAEGVEAKKMRYSSVKKFIATNIEKSYFRPVSARFTTFKDFDIFEYVMDNDGLSHDISIRGLGWISLTAKGQTIRVHLPKGTALKESLSKIS